MSSTQEKKMIEYVVEGDRIFRDDGQEKMQVAKYDPDGGIVEMMPEKTGYRTHVIRHLNDKGYKYEAVGKLGMKLENPDAPKKPPMSRVQGDKTPQVVEWYAKYFPEEFLARYGCKELMVRTGFREEREERIDKRSGDKVIHTKQVPTYEKANKPLEKYDLDRLRTGEEVIVADRKTHITDISRSGDSLDSEFDDALDEKIHQENEERRKGGLI